MFVLGHLGFGAQMARALHLKLPKKAFWLGALLPDLIDKPVYYFLSWRTGAQGAAVPIIHGTRSAGHTLLFLMTLSVMSLYLNRSWMRALTWGVISHLALDFVSDQIVGFPQLPLASHLPLSYPMRGEIPAAQHLSLSSHLFKLRQPFFLITEILGGLLLLYPIGKHRSLLKEPPPRP